MSRRSLLLSSATLFLLAACAGSELPTSADPAGAALAKAPAVSDPFTEFTLASDATLGLQADGVSKTYKHGVCGVHSKIFATLAASNSGDAIMHASNPKFRDAKCKDYPRKLFVTYTPGVVESTSGQLLVDNLQNTMFSIPVGDTISRAMNLADTRCGGLKWRVTTRDGVPIGGDDVTVARKDASTWHVFNTAESNRAICTATGDTLRISVDFTITLLP